MKNVRKSVKMKVLIYGIGRFTESIEKLIDRGHEIIGYTDSFCKLNKYCGKTFYKLDAIRNVNFDYIIITVQERKTAWEIRQKLVNDYNIDGRKIIPFSIYAKNGIVENELNTKEVQGIILGNSHAYHGYLPDCLDEDFVNLSCPSQGIYHNYKAFSIYSNDNMSILKRLKYIVFDLYDYNYFNSDISLTRGLFSYIGWGG